MTALFSAKQNKGLNLVIDIQSNVVTVTLAHFNGDKDPKVLYFSSDPIPYKEHVSSDYIIKMMLQTMEDLVVRAIKEGLSRAEDNSYFIQDIHYILSSPWVMSRAKNIKVHYDKDTEITSKIIQDIISEARDKLSKKYEADLVFIEDKVFDIKLNGYTVQSYKGKKAKDLEVSFALTLSSDKIVKEIRAATSKHLHISREVYHSALLLHYISVRANVGNSDEYIVVHTHGELTDTVIVKKGFSAYFESFLFGTTTVVRKLAVEMKSSYETADSMLCMSEDGRLEEPQQKKVNEALTPIIKSWQQDCLKAFTCIGKDVVLPRKIYLSSPGHFDIFKKSLREAGFEVISFDKPLMEIYILALKDMI